MHISKLFTVYLLVGPSNSGKTYWTNHSLIPALKKTELKEDLQIVHLSSDEIRQQILGVPAGKYDYKMNWASPMAFDLMFKRLEYSMTYPVNAHFIIIDSTGLNSDFRDQVQAACQTHHYNCELVLFDFKDQNEYYQGLTEHSQKKVTQGHVTRFKKDVMGSLKRKTYSQVLNVTSRYETLDLTVESEAYNKSILPEGTYTVIGDIHGSLGPFKALLTKLGVTIDGDLITSVPEKVGKLVLLGDYIDKGSESGLTVRFIYKNKDWFIITQGNHEKWVITEFDQRSGIDEKLKKKAFNSFYELDLEERGMLKELFNRSMVFYKNSQMILTHAPVSVKHLGKMDKLSDKLMRKTHSMTNHSEFETDEDYIKYLENEHAFLKTEAVENHPFHVFGHRAFPRIFKEKNKVGIDTGSVYGGYLSAATITEKGGITFTSVKTEKLVEDTRWGFIAPFMKIEHKDVILTGFDQTRLETLAENKVNFISGTISPADKTQEELESLDEALDYYKEHTSQIVVQVKHMGSRANFYLNRDITKCRAVSRNGFLIKHDLTSVYETLLKKHTDLMTRNGWEEILIDGELMPWSFMGKGLIDDQYQAMAKIVASELKLIKDAGFNEALQTLKIEEPKNHRVTDSQSAVKYFKFDIEEEIKNIESYKKQVDIYGNESAVHFLGFSLLKAFSIDGTEIIFIKEDVLTRENYKLVSDQEFLVVDFSDPCYKNKVKSFYEQTVGQSQEGIVIKPEFTFMPGVAPFIKVRNKEYLRLIYGYNYTSKETMKKLIDKKSVKKKRKVSASEYRIGKQLLEVKKSDILKDNLVYKNLVARMIFEEQIEQTVDKRL